MPRIMLIEDDVITRELYSSLLCKHEFEVITATELRTAWHKLQKEPVDAALMDLAMPDTHGIELLRNLRGHPTLKHLPVLVYTSMFIPGVVEEAQEAGATRVFDKAHLSSEKLLDALNACLISGQKAA